MEQDKVSAGEPRARLWMYALGAALAALAVYAATVAGYVFPGESTHLFTQWMGMDALENPVHPVWGWLVKTVGGWTAPASTALRMNMLSLVFGVVSTGLVCLLTGFFVSMTVKNEKSLTSVNGASVVAGLVAAAAFMFSSAAWDTSTHLDYQSFDVFMALALFSLFIPMARNVALQPALAALLGVGVAAGLVESPIFVPLVLLYLLSLIVTSVKSGRKPYIPAVLFLVAMAVAYIVFARMAAAAYLKLPEAESGGLKTVGDVMQKVFVAYLHEIRLWVSRPGWLYVVIFTVLPFIASMFAAPRGLNNERTWSQYAFHTAMSLCALIAIATPLSPSSLMRPFGVEPVATSALAAMVAGYCAAYWLLLWRTAPMTRDDAAPTTEASIGGRMAPTALGVMVALVALNALVGAFGTSRDRGEFADVCAGEIVDRLGDRTWFVTSGTLDDHLRIVADARGKELNLICLQRDMDDAYLREFSGLIKSKGLSAGSANLALSIEFGVLPFLQDWMGGNTNVTKTVAVFGVPDLWFMASASPVPECMFFGGARNLSGEVDGKKAFADFMEFWKKIDPVLSAKKGQGSRSIAKMRDPLDRLRLELRRHVGFIANNLGVMLQDLKMDKEAFELYELVLKSIDPDNISALFNEFEMARADLPVVAGRKNEILKQLKAIVDDTNRRYILWSLSRYYGYIRSAEVFARMGYGWAHSALPGNAIAHVQRARDLVPEERQAGLLNMLAQIYAADNKTQKSREIYEQILASDAGNHDAYMGLVRLAIQKGDYAEAIRRLEQAVGTAKSQEVSGMDWALLNLMKNDLGAARLSLQKVTDLKPKSLQAWALLAGVLLQQYDQSKSDDEKKKTLSELENVILPRMQSIADTPRDYYVQMTRGLVFIRKGKDFQKDARDALVVASSVRPDVSALGDMILNLDIALVDPESAEKHARQLLRQNRRNKLANYVMGSIRLQRGDYEMAETFLRISVAEEKPLATAQNDLAEVLRRLKKYAEAEKAARDAVKTDPGLYVAWETLASVLLDQNKGLDEAETCVKKAIELAKTATKNGDLRMLITLARAQLAKGDIPHYNSTVRTLNSRRSELSTHDLLALDALQKSAKGKR